jgi:hypothetical protein
MTVIENGIREASMGRSTTFPTSPVDGDIHVYPADTTNGVMWMFMYRSVPNDWEFIGGSPLFAEVTTDESTTSTSYAALATAGPSIALPFVGDYMVEIGCHSYNSGSAQNSMSYDIGATAAADVDRVLPQVSAGGQIYVASRPRRKTGLTAVTLTAKYKTSAGTAQFLNRWMRVVPIRHTP